MPLLRAGEIAKVIDKARVIARDHRGAPRRGGRAQAGEVELLTMHELPERGAFEPVDTAADDVAIIAFTSGTTGRAEGLRAPPPRPAGELRHVLEAHPRPAAPATSSPARRRSRSRSGSARSCCSRCASGRRRRRSPADARTALPEAIARAASRRCSPRRPGTARCCARAGRACPALRTCVSAGEPLPAGVSDAWFEQTGIRIVDGIGSTEMLHIFIAAPASEAQARLASGGRCRATRRGSSTTTCRRCRPARGRPARRARRRPAAATSTTRASRTTSSTAGTSPATRSASTRTATSGSRRAPTT